MNNTNNDNEEKIIEFIDIDIFNKILSQQQEFQIINDFIEKIQKYKELTKNVNVGIYC